MTAKRRSVFADRLLAFAEFVFSDGAEFRHRGAWGDFFRQRIGPAFSGRIVFEIGCNDASLLTRVAARHPTTAFLGIDWKCRALHTAAERVASEGLRNLALLHGRAQDVRRIFADGELADVWVFHPDPCDKPNELANRLLAEPFLTDLHPVLADGGSLILKTDHRGYYDSSLEVASSATDRFTLAVASLDFWSDRAAQTHAAAQEFAGEATAFESRFRKKRRPICYLALRKR